MKEKRDVQVYLALDESNHRQNNGDPEIVAGAISLREEDVKIKRKQGRRKMSLEEAVQFFKDGQRSLKIIAIPLDKLSQKHPLIQTAPIMVREFMGADSFIDISLSVLLDGKIPKWERILDELKKISGVEVNSVRCYQKRRKGPYKYMQLLRAADYGAYWAYNNLYKDCSIEHTEVTDVFIKEEKIRWKRH